MRFAVGVLLAAVRRSQRRPRRIDNAGAIKVAIMTDCKGAFAFGYEEDIGGAQAAFAAYAGARPKDTNKPSAGMDGSSMGGTPIKIVGYGCGNEPPALAVTETKRLMEKLGADVMVGPLSGDEGVTIANYAKAAADKMFINGTSGRSSRRCKMRAKNMFRYHGDGAQWNAGTARSRTSASAGARRRSSWTTTASAGRPAAGMIADFCAGAARSRSACSRR